MSLDIHYTDKTEYYVAFSHIQGIGPHKAEQLIAYFGNVKDAYHAHIQELSKLLSPKVAHDFDMFRSQNTTHSIIKDLLNKDIQVLTPDLPQYPNKIRVFDDYPLCLYIKGDISVIAEPALTFTLETKPSIAIIGPREHTSYGRHLTQLFASRLASAGITIISGMAKGIDGLAHDIALKFKAPTVAVLGCGVDIPYPAKNKELYRRIITEGGAVISEFPPGVSPKRGLFVTRNRLISGLSDGVLIIEGTKGSGTLKTASYAAQQGKPIYLPPYNLTAEYGHTFSHLMQNGGEFVFSPDDIFEKFSVKPPVLPPEMVLSLTSLEAEIVSLIRKEFSSSDAIATRMNMPITQILNKLSELEITGHIAKNSLGEYYVC